MEYGDFNIVGECKLKPQAESLLFATVLLLQPIHIEEVDRVLQSVGLRSTMYS